MSNSLSQAIKALPHSLWLSFLLTASIGISIIPFYITIVSAFISFAPGNISPLIDITYSIIAIIGIITVLPIPFISLYGLLKTWYYFFTLRFDELKESYDLALNCFFYSIFIILIYFFASYLFLISI